jgi:hypothetical protein
MAELKNTFSWSYSAASDFDECRRKRYWGKYAMWGGWDARASEIQKKAYRLNKMDNRFSLQGNAVEMAIMWALKQHQSGRKVTTDEAYQEIARPYLNRCWKESRGGEWSKNPKRYCCLHEHYYAKGDAAADKAWTAEVVNNVKTCVDNFLERVLPRLENVAPEQEVEIHTPDQGGDPESFVFEGIKVYAIPDYVYRDGDAWHIHDWKSGRQRDSHRNQVALYGLWANVKHGVSPEQITVYLEYLKDGVMAYEPVTGELLEGVRETLRGSVADMSDYLVDANRELNQALPKEEWELALSRRSCDRCDFFELCEPELKE